MKLFLFFILALLPSPFLRADTKTAAAPALLNLPGQVEKVGNLHKIYLAAGLWAEGEGNRIALNSLAKPSVAAADLSASPEKSSVASPLGGDVLEQDLGGSLKKKAPLAHKNPLFRDIQVPQGGDPLKASGKKPIKLSEEKTADGTTTTTEYPDGSKSVLYVSPSLKEESAYNRKGDIIWRNMEGEVQGLRFKKTQWEDGSRVWEYSNAKGTLSVLWDQERKVSFVSFLNVKGDLIKEVACQNGSCETN